MANYWKTPTITMVTLRLSTFWTSEGLCLAITAQGWLRASPSSLFLQPSVTQVMFSFTLWSPKGWTHNMHPTSTSSGVNGWKCHAFGAVAGCFVKSTDPLPAAVVIKAQDRVIDEDVEGAICCLFSSIWWFILQFSLTWSRSVMLLKYDYSCNYKKRQRGFSISLGNGSWIYRVSRCSVIGVKSASYILESLLPGWRDQLISNIIYYSSMSCVMFFYSKKI